MDCEWKEMRNLRRSSLSLAGRSYSGVFAKRRGLEGREKAISGPFEELSVDNVTEEEWRKQWDKVRLKSLLWIPEPVEVAVGEGGSFFVDSTRISIVSRRRRNSSPLWDDSFPMTTGSSAAK